MNKSCIVCEGLDTKVVFQEFGIDILRCTTCGHVFSSYNADQNYDGFFDAERMDPDYQYWLNEAHERMYEDFYRRFVAGKNGAMLDVGCGLGYFVKRMTDISSWKVFGAEISKEAVDFARVKLELPNIFCGRIEDSRFSQKSFDIITLWDVIEHIPDPDPLLSHLSFLLKDDGMLFLHTPNVNVQLPKARIKKLLKGMRIGTHYLEAKDHINNYSEKTIQRVLRRNGYNNVQFIHLYPVQSVYGSRNQILRYVKNLWFYFSVALFRMTFGRINLDNLFVIAKK